MTTPKVNHRTFEEIGLDKFSEHMGELNKRTKDVYLRNTKLIKNMMSDDEFIGGKWNFNSYGEFFYFMRIEGFFNLILTVLKKKILNDNTLKGRYNCLIKINQFLKETYKHQLETSYYQKNLQTLSVKLADITIEINKKLSTQKMNEKEQINMCELEKLQEKVKKIPQFITQTKENESYTGDTFTEREMKICMDKLLIHLYTYLPARRGEYNGMIVLYKDKDKKKGFGVGTRANWEHWGVLNYYDIWENKFYINDQKKKKKSREAFAPRSP